MTDHLDRIEEDLDELLLARNISPRDREAVHAAATEVVGAYTTLAGRGVVPPLASPERVVDDLVSDVCDYGVLGQLFATPGIEDITIRGEQVRYFWQGRWKAPRWPTTERRNRHVVMRLLADTGVPLDQQKPTVDGVQILDGKGRLAGAIPPVSTVLDITIRLYVARSAALEELVEWGSLTSAAAELLRWDLRAKGAILISGETASGKTTVASALLREADPGHVVRLVEEYREIDFSHDLGGSMQIHLGAEEGQQCRSIAGLVRLALRLHADLVAVGEVRGREAWELSSAAGVGAGFLCTIHAPNAVRALERLALLSRNHEDRPEPDLIRETFSHLLHFVLHCERGAAPDGTYVHQVTEVRVVVPPTDPARGFSSEVIFERPAGLGTPMRWTKIALPEAIEDRIARVLPRGWSVRELLEGP